MEQIDQGLFRLLVPFEELTTTVYVVLCPTGVALIDSATTQYDAEQVILPALREHGIALTDVRYLLLTHDHGDHAGGAPYLLEHLPRATLRCPFDSPLSAAAPLFDGEVIAVIRRLDDVEDKWVVAPKGVSFSKEEILQKVYF